MNFKKILLFLLVFTIVVALITGINLCLKYTEIGNICSLIRSGQSSKAIELIMNIPDVNEYSAPLWIRPILLALEFDIDLPMVVACKTGNTQVINALIERGADPNKYLEGNWSPIEATFAESNSNRLEIAKLLIKNGAEIDAFGSRQSALFLELSALLYNVDWTEDEINESIRCINFLLENGANSIDEQGNTVVHYLACVSGTTILEEALSNYIELASYQNQKGQTPLMWAAHQGNIEGVRCLISHGVPVDALDYAGNSAIDYAERKDHQEIIELLQGQGDGSVVPSGTVE